MKNMKLFIFVVALFQTHYVQGDYNFSERGKECIKKLDITEADVAGFVVNNKIDENNELALKYFGCRLDAYITDSNEIIVNEEYTSYVTNVFAKQIHKTPELVRGLAEECIQTCKHIKTDSKGKTAVQVTNCLMKTFKELKGKILN